MDYQDAVAAFFAPSPPDTVAPPIVRQGGPARRLRDAIEPIAMHAVWCARTNRRLADAFGLDFLGAYVWGRASALGDAAPGVVVAGFAVFEPSFLAGVYTDARSKAAWADLVAARDAATEESLGELLPGEAVADVTAVLRRGIDAADPAGRPLFAGLAGREWPTDGYGQLWRACDILREHRGDSHIAACVAAGLDAVEMNVLTEVWLGMPAVLVLGHPGLVARRAGRGRRPAAVAWPARRRRASRPPAATCATASRRPPTPPSAPSSTPSVPTSTTRWPGWPRGRPRWSTGARSRRVSTSEPPADGSPPAASRRAVTEPVTTRACRSVTNRSVTRTAYRSR